MFAGNFAPAGWMFCEGQMLPISENETLFNLIGTTYGGDGQETYCLPDLRGRIPVHNGNGYILAETGGVEEVTLTVQQIPAHNHGGVPSTVARGNAEYGANGAGVLASTGGTPAYAMAGGAPVDMAVDAIGASDGQSQPHSNMAPYLCVNFIISLFGIFPSQN
ncbi:phage tail protein [Duganella sp. PWIR1]